MPPASAQQRIFSTFISYRLADNMHDGRRWAEWLRCSFEVMKWDAVHYS